MPFDLPEPTRTRQLTTYDPASRHKVISLQPGDRADVGVAVGPGYLTRLWLTFPGWFWPHWEPDRPVDQRILKNVHCRIYLDDAEQPQLSAPVADLFGIGLCRMSNFAALRLGASSGGFYLAFAMPFLRSLRIEIENTDPQHPTDVFCNALYQQVAGYDTEPRYFHGFFSTGRHLGPEPIDLVDVSAGGYYAGCTLACQAEPRNYLGYLEAPEHIYLDDDVSSSEASGQPSIVGTGMEDYFLGGWYFREGPVIGPDHGVPLKDALDSATTMYRIHDLDAIHFRRRFRMGFTSPWDADRLRPYAHSGVSFLYLDRIVAAPEVPTGDALQVWYRIPSSDHQAIP